jgi:hypothetical protein
VAPAIEISRAALRFAQTERASDMRPTFAPEQIVAVVTPRAAGVPEQKRCGASAGQSHASSISRIA